MGGSGDVLARINSAVRVEIKKHREGGQHGGRKEADLKKGGTPSCSRTPCLYAFRRLTYRPLPPKFMVLIMARARLWAAVGSGA